MSCHSTPNSPPEEQASAVAPAKCVVLCGQPNVGKSLIFNLLTGRYATVSNYPGTTVMTARGTSQRLPGLEVVDTPGAYSFMPITDEERVARDMVAEAKADIIVHVVDAKNLRRMLSMTLELLELGRRVVLVLNVMDEARRLGVQIDTAELGVRLGIPVIPMVALRGEGLEDLVCVVRDGMGAPAPDPAVKYPDQVYALAKRLGLTTGGSARRANPAIMTASAELGEKDPDAAAEFELAVRLARQRHADHILAECASFPAVSHGAFASLLNRLTMNFWTALPIALAVLYFGVYWFVGQFGAGTLVDWIENGIYEPYITPWITRAVEALVPWPVVQDLFVHDYGMLTLGLRYAIALILPIVGTFFLLFSVLEDSGYLPRMALLLDGVFKRIGLNGRAVIPIILGFGCGTMATMVTRILETRRERVITTLLLGVAIPCSAQLGVILAMTTATSAIFVTWCSIMAAIFMVLGLVAARTMPGEAPAFYLEMPPLRRPRLRNVLTKTYSRMHWYFREILPLFLAASVVMWLGHVTGAFKVVVAAMEPVVRAMGLPAAAASSLLFGFFRRDYGAAGLLDLQRHGGLDHRQLFVCILVISLFLPCVAQFFIMKKERGWRFSLATALSILVFAAGMGILANAVLTRTGWLG
jgi:ferrous iron transport protein B